ncbi:hypothetical protein ACFSQ3_08165 [Sphingobacterium corticis]|uniref:N-acetyltransferase domain-containing protein n=1 Tax=Sphingobacterium corticis TaxID=1812823 RepID=A0ABW5NJ43_9SPHI
MPSSRGNEAIFFNIRTIHREDYFSLVPLLRNDEIVGLAFFPFYRHREATKRSYLTTELPAS